jgi:hypothetical protein
VSRVEEVHLGIGEIAEVRVGARFDEDGVASSPDDPRGRRVAAQPGLPLRVSLDVAVVVECQIDLDLLASG